MTNNQSDYTIATAGSVVLHLIIIAVAIFFARTGNPLVSIPEPNIIHAQLVSIEDIRPEEIQPQQRVIDLTKQPPTSETTEPERLQMPDEDVAEQEEQEPDEPEDDVAEETTSNDADDRAEREEQELLQRQVDLASQLDAELGALEEIENQQIVMSYASWISERVGNNWSRPPSARSGMIVKLRVSLVPTGRVVSVDIVESSGDDAFDNSALQAVYKAEPYTRLTELSQDIFDEQFREFYFSFNPQDLRL